MGGWMEVMWLKRLSKRYPGSWDGERETDRLGKTMDWERGRSDVVDWLSLVSQVKQTHHED